MSRYYAGAEDRDGQSQVFEDRSHLGEPPRVATRISIRGIDARQLAQDLNATPLEVFKTGLPKHNEDVLRMM